MGKKKHESQANLGKYSVEAQENAKALAQALNAAGLHTSIDTYHPCWCNPKGKPYMITQVLICNLSDSDGEQIEFKFSHDTGHVMTDDDFWSY